MVLGEREVATERRRVNFGGRCVHHPKEEDGFRVEWIETYKVDAIPELMRLLMDEHHLSWNTA